MKRMGAGPVSGSELVLASASPRRQDLMWEAGYTFDVVVPNVDEAHDASLSCEALTMANAKLKAEAGLVMKPGTTVIGADTLVYLDELPLGKPKDLTEAREMLEKLSGRVHQVCTGVALASETGTETFAVVTEVEFLPLTEDRITEYLGKVHVLDKAGSYAVQEHGDLIVKRVSGSLSNVIGLPMEVLSEKLANLAAGGGLV